MLTHLHKPSTRRDLALARQVDAIIQFAELTPDFAHWLTHTLIEETLPTTVEAVATSELLGSHYFVPRDTTHAVVLTHWLLAQCATAPERYPLTSTRLREWRERRTVPKDQIFGIIGIAIIGPTLGLIKSKKKKKSQLRIILPQAVYEATPKAALTGLTHTISGRTIATELRHARGHVRDLHPDTAEWLMSDHTTTLYTANTKTYTTIEDTLTTCQLPHISHSLTDTTMALGISPSLSDSFLADFEVVAVSATTDTETRQ